MRCFRGEELNLLQQHQATTADKLFVFGSNYIQGAAPSGPGRQDISS